MISGGIEAKCNTVFGKIETVSMKWVKRQFSDTPS